VLAGPFIGLQIRHRMSDPRPHIPSEPPLIPDAAGLDGTAASDAIELESAASQSLGKENRQIAVLVLVVAAVMLLAHFTPLRGWLTNVQTWKGYVREFGLWAHLVFGSICAIAVMAGIPRLPLCAAAGLAFGFGQGLALSLVATTLGSYGTFLTARMGGRKAAVVKAQSWGWLARLLKRPSLARVFWVRQIMIPGLILNVLLGLTAVSHRAFLGGTLLGYLPLNVAFALSGSAIGKGSLVHSMAQLMGAVAVVNIAGFAVWKVLKKHRATQAE